MNKGFSIIGGICFTVAELAIWVSGYCEDWGFWWRVLIWWAIVIRGFDAWNWGNGWCKNWGKCKIQCLIMHGRIQRDDERSRSLKRSRSKHMRSVPPLSTADKAVASAADNHSPVGSSITTSTTGSSFFKVLIWWFFEIFVFYCICLLQLGGVYCVSPILKFAQVLWINFLFMVHYCVWLMLFPFYYLTCCGLTP